MGQLNVVSLSSATGFTVFLFEFHDKSFHKFLNTYSIMQFQSKITEYAKPFKSSSIFKTKSNKMQKSQASANPQK